MLIERTEILEKYSKYLEEKVSSLTKKNQEEESSKDFKEFFQNYAYEHEVMENKIHVLNNINIKS